MIPTSTIDRTMEFTLRLIGVWPDSSCRFLSRVVWTMTMITSQLLQYWYLFTHIGSDTLPDILDSLSLCLSNSLLFLKLSLLWLNGRIIYNLFATMAEDWNECASTRLKMQSMINKAILSRRFSRFSIGAYSCSIFLFGVGNMVIQKSTEQLVEERQLIVKMELPPECSISPLYEIVSVTQFLVQSTLALVAGMLNAFIVTLILHVAGQIDIICHELLEIPVAEDKCDMRIVALRSIVNRHQRIIAFADSIENVFCYMALMQFFSNMFVICFLGFIIVTSLNSPDVDLLLMRIMPYYIVMNLEAFVLCYSGEYLNSKSKSINEAAYNSFWYELKSTESKIIFFLIMKSQRELTMTIGKFMNLSLEGFTSILQASASYVSVLHAMY
ncbi:hypothetical protein P5V15_014577 [Pogonomyrmex californicus]